MKHGVLFVAIGVKGSAYEQIEWRLSFSVGEKFLIYTFTHTQCICYSLMKILLKEQIDIDIECKDLLCSYFMKTILFWLSEELPISIWRPENLISCFMRCFRRLIYYVEYSVCPHYFIPENTLFEDKIKGKARETLLHKLKIIYSYGWKFLVFPFEISNTEISFLFEQIQLNQRNTNYVNNSNVQKLLSSNIQCITGYGIASDKLWENGIHMIMSHKSSKIKSMCLYYMSRMITLLETKQVKDIYDNKSKYQEYKTRISTLVQNIYHDSVTGWLKLASFFYKTKQFKIALVIIRYSLLKCTPEKLYPHMKKSGFPHDQLNIRVFRKMNFVKLWKYLLVDYVVLYPDCMLTLEELEIEVSPSKSCILKVPSIVYAHFLCFLCHNHLNDARRCQESLLLLQTTIEENYLLSTNITIGVSYNILGITFELIGDKGAAKQAFIQSIRYYPSVEKNTAYRRLISLMFF